MLDALEPSPCSIFYYKYKGPRTTLNNPSPFTIHCTLEKGAEIYYSGVRVVVLAKKIGFDDDFAKAEIQARSPLYEEEEDDNECEDKDDVHVFSGHSPSDTDLPFYTLIFELVDLSDKQSTAADVMFTGAETSTTASEPVQVPDTHRILYDSAKNTTIDSPSCIFLLTTEHVGLRRSFKYRFPSRMQCRFPALIGLPTYGFRILPPSDKRPLFTQPPSEILYEIFSFLKRDVGSSKNWRKELVAASLVCRAWKIALCVISKDH